MTVKIDGTVIQKRSGGGLGGLLGKIAGGIAGVALAPVTGGASLGAAMTGMGIGGAAGSAIGGLAKKGGQTDLGVPVGNARGGGTAVNPMKPNAIDRLNSLMDIGSTIAGGADSLNKLMAPKPSLGASSAMDRRLLRIE